MKLKPEGATLPESPLTLKWAKDFPSREIFEFIAEMTVAFGPWDSIDCAYDECMELWEDFTTSRFYTMDKSYLTCVQEFISWLETPTNWK